MRRYRGSVGGLVAHFVKGRGFFVFKLTQLKYEEADTMAAAEERKASIFSAALMSEVGSVSQTATQLSCKPKLSSTWKLTLSPRCEMYEMKEKRDSRRKQAVFFTHSTSVKNVKLFVYSHFYD